MATRVLEVTKVVKMISYFRCHWFDIKRNVEKHVESFRDWKSGPTIFPITFWFFSSYCQIGNIYRQKTKSETSGWRWNLFRSWRIFVLQEIVYFYCWCALIAWSYRLHANRVTISFARPSAAWRCTNFSSVNVSIYWIRTIWVVIPSFYED